MPPLPRYASTQKLSDWPDYYLELTCARCSGRSVIYPMPRLIAKQGDSTFRDLLGRLKCAQCGEQPSAVFLCASQNRKANHGGPAPDWALELDLMR